MKSRMTVCYDYKLLNVADELRKWKIPDSEIAQELERLSADFSGEEKMEGPVEEGDCVRCRCISASEDAWKGRSILLYPGRRLPGAEEAEENCIGRKAGEVFNGRIRDVEVELEIEEVIRRHLISVGPELMKKLNLPGVETVKDYYRWYHEQHDKERKQKACFAIVNYWLTELAKRSEFAIDEDEKNELCQRQGRIAFESMLAAGYDMRKRPDGGEPLTTEEALAEAAATRERYFIPYVIYQYFCEKDGFVLTENDYKAAIEAIARERGMDLEDAYRQADFDMYLESKYQEHTYYMLAEEAKTYLEV